MFCNQGDLVVGCAGERERCSEAGHTSAEGGGGGLAIAIARNAGVSSYPIMTIFAEAIAREG